MKTWTASIASLLLALNATAGEITGKITLKGTPPPERTVELTNHVAIAKQLPQGFTTRHYRYSPDGGLRDVLISVRGNFAGQTFAPPRHAVVLDHVNWWFEPKVIGVQVGQPLQLKCSDGTLCSFVAMFQANKPFSIAPLPQGVTRTLTDAEPPTAIKCDLHPWNFAYVGAFTHPFFAVSDNDGKFTISNLPTGTYTMDFYHPRSGTVTQTVTVAEKPASIAVEMPVK